MDVLNAVFTHYDAVLGVLGAVHGLALAVVNLTETPKDDVMVSKVYRVVEIFAGIFSPRVKL